MLHLLPQYKMMTKSDGSGSNGCASLTSWHEIVRCHIAIVHAENYCASLLFEINPALSNLCQFGCIYFTFPFLKRADEAE